MEQRFKFHLLIQEIYIDREAAMSPIPIGIGHFAKYNWHDFITKANVYGKFHVLEFWNPRHNILI